MNSFAFGLFLALCAVALVLTGVDLAVMFAPAVGACR